MEIYINLVLIKLNVDKNLLLRKKIRGKPGITWFTLIEALLLQPTVELASKHLGYSETLVSRVISEYLHPYFPSRGREFSGGDNSSWAKKLLTLIEYKKCYGCKDIISLHEYYGNTSSSDTYSSCCKSCSKVNKYLRDEHIDIRTPIWADIHAIRNFYKCCPDGHEVDHILPLRGDLVSGLHVVNNLQYLSKEDNRFKSNKFLPY